VLPPFLLDQVDVSFGLLKRDLLFCDRRMAVRQYRGILDVFGRSALLSERFGVLQSTARFLEFASCDFIG